MCILFLAVSCLTPISKTPRNHDNQRRQMPSKCQKNFSSRSCVRPPGACRVIIAFQGLGFLSIATTTTSIRRSRTRERNLQYNILVVKFEKIFQEKGPQTQSKTKQKLSSAASFSAGIILTNGSLTTQHAHCKGKLKSHRPYQMSSLTTEKKTLRNEKPSAVVVNQTSIHNTRIRNLAARGEQIRWRGKKRERQDRHRRCSSNVKTFPYEQLHLITGSHDVYRCHLKKSVARSDYPTNKRQQEGTKV